MTQHIALGKRGEQIAANSLAVGDFVVLDRNWRCVHGEVDIVAREGREVVFVEVKTRRSLRAGHPLEAITPQKVRRMHRVAYEWLAAHPEQRGVVRLDAISVVLPYSGQPAVLHLTGIGE